MIDNADKRAHLLDLLYRSLDGVLTAEERHALETGLLAHVWLREERAILLEMRLTLGNLHPKPNPSFVDEVMRNIPPQEHLMRPLVVQWRAIAAAACLALLLGGGVIYGSAGSWETEAILGLNEMELDDVYAFDE